MLMCEDRKELIKIPVYDGMDLEDVQALKRQSVLYKREKVAMDELKAASEGISEEERKKLGW